MTNHSHPLFLCFKASGSSNTDNKDGFENRNWNRDVIHLRYEMQHAHSEWEELFLSQKPFAVRTSFIRSISDFYPLAGEEVSDKSLFMA